MLVKEFKLTLHVRINNRATSSRNIFFESSSIKFWEKRGQRVD
jgi:hypothetical protein